MALSVYQLTILGNLGGQFVENLVHVESDTETGTENPVSHAQAAIIAWRSAIESAFMDTLPTDYDLIGYKCKRVNNGGGPMVAQPVGSTPGTRTGVLVEQAAGPCVIFPYSHAGAFHTGRLFLAGVTATDCIDGAIQPALAGNVGVLAGLLNSTFDDGTGHAFNFVIWQRKFSLAIGPLLGTVSLKVGIQRRRLTPVM